MNPGTALAADRARARPTSPTRRCTIASTGLAFAVVFVTPDALARCRPDMTVLREEFSYPQPATGVYVVAWDADRRHARVRMFAGDMGIARGPGDGFGGVGVRRAARGAR